MRLQKLIVVRHGYYDSFGTEKLTPDGKAQVSKLTEALATKLNGSNVAILSSTAPRAQETTEILQAGLGSHVATVEKHKCLWSGGDNLRQDQVDEAARLIDEKAETHDVVVLSTHMEFIDDFLTIWGKRRGLTIPTSRNTAKGTARLLDLSTGQVEHVVPRRQ